jgi:GNAT superfamily N-acetyltransferase
MMKDSSLRIETTPLVNESGCLEWALGDYVVSTDRSRLSLSTITRFLSEESWWAKGLSVETIVRSINGSLVFGVYSGKEQIAFCRVITDCARMAYLADVYVDSHHRGRGIGSALSAVVRTHPDLSTILHWLLMTPDAGGVYEKTGWHPIREPKHLLQIVGDDPLRTALQARYPYRQAQVAELHDTHR